MAGLFTLIFFLITWAMNIYLIYATNRFIHNQKHSSKLEKLNQILVWLYITTILTYIVFSLSFLYLKEIGWGNLLALLALGMTLIQRHFFKKYHKKLLHMLTVKKFVLEDTIPSESSRNNSTVNSPLQTKD